MSVTAPSSGLRGRIKAGLPHLTPLTAALSGRVISAAGVLLFNILVTRQLSLSQAGQVLTAFVALMGMAILLQGGMTLLLIRKLAVAQGDRAAQTRVVARIVATVLVLACGVSALAGLIAWGLGWSDQPIGYLWLALLPTTLIGLAAAVFKARGHPGWGGFWEVGMISVLASGALLITPQTDALTVWWIFCMAAWLACLLAFGHMLCARIVPAPGPGLLRPSLAPMIEARHLGLIAGLSYLAQWGGVLLSSVLLGEDSVTLLNALFRLLAPLQFVILTLDAWLAPEFAVLEPYQARHLRRVGICLGLGLAGPYAAVLLLFPDAVMTALFGAEFAGQGLAIALLMAGTLTQIALGANGILLTMRGDEARNFHILCLRVTLFLIGSACLVPLLGYPGFVLMFAVSILLQSLLNRVAADHLLRAEGA
ncbi:MAG: hypothetical protein AAF503_00700 [Pseudomonadota bacterium]